MVLRKYQELGVSQVFLALHTYKRVLYVLPTGGGKTVTFCGMANEFCGDVLIEAHRQELLRQISETAERFGLPSEKICVESVIKVANSIKTRKKPGLLIVDEAHHAVAGSYKKIFDYWHDVPVIGVTATPCRLDGRGLGEVFETMVKGPSMKELIAQGSLVPSRIYSIPTADFSKLKKSKGDYDQKQLDEEFEKIKSVIFGDAISQYKEKADGKKAVVFTHSVAAAKEAADAFCSAGYLFASLDGQMNDADRKRVVSSILSGDLDGITSCNLVSEGFDCPGLEVAIMLRPTASLQLYLQQCGRVLRPADGKTFGLILDHVGNARKFGPPEIDREWSLEGKEQGAAKSANNVKTVTCKECFGVYMQSSPKCPYCENVRFTEPKEIKLLSGELVLFEYGEVKETLMSKSQYGYYIQACNISMPDGKRPRSFSDYESLGYTSNEIWNFLRAVKKAREIEKQHTPQKGNVMSEKIYCGRGKQGRFGVRISLCLNDLPKEHITTANNGKKYISLNVDAKREPDQYGNTHSVSVDTWKPGQQNAPEPAPADDLPF
jgi:superfamily II DNA or RNA helicase